MKLLTRSAEGIDVLPANVGADEARRQFVRLFSHTACHHRRYEVFADFIALVARELDVAGMATQPGNDEYTRIRSRYSDTDFEQFHHLFELMIRALERKHHDFLGSVFMELELGDSRMGQFFTPWELTKMLAQLLRGDILAQLQDQPFVTFGEPASGAGGMVIAWADVMLEAGANPAEHLFASCTDLDQLAADMTYVQLSLLGIPAEVKTGNSLSQNIRQTRYTPVYYLNGWDFRLSTWEMLQALRKLVL
ncbi:N-6 DNA methylase [Pantoea cypripedii]|uniref:DNA methylase adenine-specific domain-containing protein n=1 Tax=Pantoea cypripedii TaxID=55209 RepID=A0A1X1EMQ6_PANCY|nr:N-6 DNA methylase [Pantoea cypripedii]MBP2199248.1 hypothetical protein [Pantoea cypripedii]ORM90240.1 hypothetical protein HA50_27295 [Pantoea cypripedii]